MKNDFYEENQRYFRKLAIPKRSHPLVKRLFEEMNAKRIGITHMADVSGVNRNTISDWKRRCMPRLDNIAACYETLGLNIGITNDPQKD